MTLEEILAELFAYSNPRLMCMDDEWFCSAKLRVSVVGGEFEIKSDFKHATPKAAAEQCLSRVRECLQEIHKMAPAVPQKPQLKALEGQSNE